MHDIEVMSHDERAIDAGQIQRLYAAEGWWPERSTADIDRIVGSGPAVGAWAGPRLVGFVRAVTDGVARAYVEDMVVDRERRSEGIGGRLMGRLHRDLVGVDVVSLFCGAELTAFYEAAGYSFTGQRVGHHRPLVPE